MIPTFIVAINTIELVGTYIATHLESGTTICRTKLKNRNTTKSVIPVICRELINRGHSPHEPVHVIRKALDQPSMIPVFMQDKTLAVWAMIDVVESDTLPPHVVRHRHYNDAVDAKIAQEQQ